MNEFNQNMRSHEGVRLFLLFLAILIALSGFVAGRWFGHQQALRRLVPEGEGRVLNQGVVSETLAEDVDFMTFWDVWNLIKERYYDQPVSDKDLYYGALKGMVEATGDSYTTFFDPEEAQQFAANLEGSFEGIGSEIGIRDDQLQIVAPLPDTPASRAGLQPGDWIVAIDETDTTGMSVEEAVVLIRGEKGTEVVLTIVREGVDESFDVPIIRGKIVVDSVRTELREDNVLVIDIFTFNGDTNKLFNEAVNQALQEGVEGIILDLRSNPGGLLSSAIHVSSAWVGYDTVVIERAQDRAETFAGVMSPRLADIPTVVLVNGGSASGSEIVAGALQDAGLATIVGTQTFGKGSVQDYRELADGSAVKLTIAEWYTPNGRSINQTGITPDVIVDISLEDIQHDRDPQKEKAVELLFEAE